MLETAFNLSAFQGIQGLLPEFIVTLGLILVLVLSIAAPKKTVAENNVLMGISLAALLSALFALSWVFQQQPLLSAPQTLFLGTLTLDSFSILIRLILVIGAGITIAISHHFLRLNTRIMGDFYALILGATLGGMFLASATDLITVFVGLETLSITSYILAGYLRRTVASTEASFKYLVYGGAATGVFLFGLSLVYGLVGSTQFSDIAGVFIQYHVTATPPTILLAMLMVFSALAFKLSLAPFHIWTPDVYEGSPTPVAAFLSVVSKTAAFAIAIRLAVTVFILTSQIVNLFIVLAILSMVIGNFVALKQTSLKRLLAYSTIAQAGYMILGFLVLGPESVASILFYLMTYVFMNLGAFAGAISFQNLTGSDDIASYSGLFHKRPLLAFGITICLLSLAGIPITAGFFAKFFLFKAVASVAPIYLWFVGIALVNSLISLAYYINVIRLMVVKEPSAVVNTISSEAPQSTSLNVALSFCVVMTLLLGIISAPLYEFTQLATQQLGLERGMQVGQLPRFDSK